MKACKFIVVDREGGNCIDGFDTLSEAEAAVKKFEAEDIENDCFIEGFYEIVEDEGDSGYHIDGADYRRI